MLEIELLCANAKAGFLDRVLCCKLFQDILSKAEYTQHSSVFYLACLVRLAHQQLGIGYYQTAIGNLQKALNLIENGRYSKHQEINKLKIEIFTGMAKIYHNRDNNYSVALSFYETTLQLVKTPDLTYKLIDILGHQGIIHRKLRNYELGIYLLQKALSIAILIDSEKEIEWINHHLAYIYLDQNHYDLAESLAQHCLQNAYQESRENELGDYYEQIGLIKLAQNEINYAIDNFRNSLYFRQKIGNLHGTASCFKDLSLTSLLNKNYSQSCLYMKECILIFIQLKAFNVARLYTIFRFFLRYFVLILLANIPVNSFSGLVFKSRKDKT